MKLLVLILARGGSERLPGKNIRPLGGRPLISWSIDIAKKIPDVCEILVSTDCNEIGEISRKEGAVVPWLRPAHLSSGSASSVDAAIHSLDWYELEHGSVDGLILLQPTSPFRELDKILESVALFKSSGYRAVVSVSPAPVNPAWCFAIEQESLLPALGWEKLQNSSVKSGLFYCLNGSVYIIAPDTLREDRTFLPKEIRPVLMGGACESLDIDTEQDWDAAVSFLENSL